MNNDKAVRQYCERYAEPEIHWLQHFPEHRFQHLIVIPAHRESDFFLAGLQQLAERQGRTLAVLVINGPDAGDQHSLDEALWQSASASGAQTWTSDRLKLVSWRNQSGILLVDRFSGGRGIPAKQGVGLARKIGCDIGLALHAQGKIRANFIHNSDADAELPADYLDRAANTTGVSALVYPFAHTHNDDPNINEATTVYEQSLHYYVNGLRWAGSPYAFHTIGSSMAVSMHHYAQARGFPKRAGGEDFYLLNKLAKLAPVIEISGDPIRLQSRNSDRVPFGTGPAVAKILALSSPSEFTTYAPDVFVELAQLLRGFNALWKNRNDSMAWLSQLPEAAHEACLSLEIEILLRHLQKQAKNEKQCLHYAHQWFDGFRTLKFVRHLQNQYYPAIPLVDALARATQMWQEPLPREL